MKSDILYDVAVTGGGLAGLSAAISCAKKGASVILMEKETYPFHKVCGEYISMESQGYLRWLGLKDDTFQLPKIDQLIVTSPSGKSFTSDLRPGGFGISRFLLDAALKECAQREGVTVMENCRVDEVKFSEGSFLLSTTLGEVRSKICTGSFGKKSNLDVKWKRPFTQAQKSKLNNYIGIKYHVKADILENTISLHNFKNGYCGISGIENGKSCLCYLTTAANLKASNNSIEEMEKKILGKNPHLQKLFSSVTRLYDEPLTISQVSFEKKSLVHDHVLLNGDAAGMISPLCGNGMSMALHSGKIASEAISLFLNDTYSRDEMENAYIKAWNQQFSSRLKAGRMLQSLFGKPVVTDLFISAIKKMPWLAKSLIRSTHGEPF